MSREVDERVVAMYFDNKNFEKNVHTTIDSLEELKKSVNIEKSVKGFDTLKKATENLKLDDVTRKVKNLQGVFQGLGSVVSKAFDIGTGPLHALHNLFSTFQGYVTKFIGFDIAGKLVNGLESAFRQLTVAPLTTGFNEYESKMDSIKTIMSGTGESLDVVKNKIQELNHYADQTIYSFSDMTSNIGKFTNNAVSLDDATSAIKGIANAAADAGQGAQQASMAMYNASQAMGVGTMKMIDWKSFENANIATQRMKSTFMEAAVAHGKLVKELDKDSQTMKYYLVDEKTGKKVKAPKDQKGKYYEVTVENFRETLNKDWLDKETMLDTFKIFSGDLKTIADFRREGFTEAMGFSDEDIEKLIKIGEEAMKAATEVRTFTKMYDALKEAAQSGWGETFEFLFGDMEEGTSLWTQLNDKISGMLEKSATARNDAFAEWRGMYKDLKGEYHQTKDLWVWDVEFDEVGQIIRRERKQIMQEQADGRTVLINSFMELIDLLREIGGTIGDAWGKVFGKFDSDKLWAITNGFKEMVDRIKGWLGSADDATSRLSKIRTGLTGVFSILKFVLNIAKTGLNLVGKLIKPVADPLLNLFEKFGKYFKDLGKLSIGDALKKIGEGFSALWGKITGLNWDTVKTKFGEAWESIKTTVKTWMDENGLTDTWNTLSSWKDKIVAWFEGVKTDLSGVWNQLTSWFESSGLSGFFQNTWGWITAQFSAPVSEDGTPDPNADAPVVTWLKGIWESIETFWNETILGTAMPVWEAIRSFGENTWGWIKAQVTVPVSEDGTPIPNAEAPIVTWLKGIWDGISKFWNETIIGTAKPVWEAIRAFGENTWGWIVTQFTVPTAEDGTPIPDAEAPIVTWLKGIWDGISKFWNETIIGTARPIWEAIRSFGENTWGWIVTQFTVPTAEDGTPVPDAEAPVVTWLKGIWESISGFWNETIMGIARPVWEAIRSFGENTWGWITSHFTVPTAEDGTPIQNADPPIVSWLKGIWEDIKSIWDGIVKWEGWSAIGLFFTNTFGWISDLVHGGSTASKGASESTAAAVAAVATGVNEAAATATEGGDPEKNAGILERVMGALSGFVEKVRELAGDIAGNSLVQGAMESIHKLLEIVGTIIKDVIGVLHDIIVDGNWGSLLDKWPYLLAGISYLVVSLVTLNIRKKITAALAETEGTGEMFMRLGIGILLIAGAAALLSAIDDGALKKGVNAIATLAIVIGVVGAVLNLTKKPEVAVEQNRVTAWERFGNNVVKWAGIMGTVWIAMEKMPAIINAMKDSNLTGEDIGTIMMSLISFISSLGLVTAVIGKIGGNDASQVKGMAYAAMGTVAAIGILFYGLIGLFGTGGILYNMTGTKSEIIAGLKTAGEIGMELTAMIGQFIGGFGLGGNRVKNATAKEDLQWMSEMAGEFTPERMLLLGRMMDSIKSLTEAIPSTFEMDRVSKFTDEMPKLGTALARFSIGFREAFKEKGIVLGDASAEFEHVLKQIEYVERLAKSMAEFQSFFRFGFDRTSMGFSDGSFISVDEEQFSALGTMYAQAAVALATAIDKGLSEEGIEGMQLKFDATPIVDSIVVALGYGETAIANAVHAMVQAGIDLSGNPKAQGEYNTEAIEKLMSGGFGDISSLWGGADTSLFGDFNVDSIFGENGLQGVIDGAIGELNVEDLSSTLETQLGGLSTEFKDMFTIDDLQTQLGGMLPTGEDGEVDMDAALASLQEKLGSIGDELSESGVEVTIRPVFDMTDLEAGIAQMNAYFQQNPIFAGLGSSIPNVTINIDNSATIGAIRDAQSSIIELGGRLSAECSMNRQAIGSMGEHVDRIADAVRSMQIYLDTGVIAGAVDRALGYSFFLAGRTGKK